MLSQVGQHQQHVGRAAQVIKGEVPSLVTRTLACNKRGPLGTLQVRRVVVAHVLEPPHLQWSQQPRDGEGVDRSIAPALVEEATAAVQRREVRLVLRRPEQREAGDFEVQPEVAQVVGAVDAGILHEIEQLRRWTGRRGEMVFRGGPEQRDGGAVLEHRQREAEHLVVGAHELKHIVVNVAVEPHPGLHPPVVLVLPHQRVVVEEPQVEPAHVAVRLAVGVHHVLEVQLVALFCRKRLVDPAGVLPVACRHLGKRQLAVGDEQREEHHELVQEDIVVEKHPVVVAAVVVAVLHALNRFEKLVHFTAAAKHQERGVFARGVRQYRLVHHKLKRQCVGQRPPCRGRHEVGQPGGSVVTHAVLPPEVGAVGEAHRQVQRQREKKHRVTDGRPMRLR